MFLLEAGSKTQKKENNLNLNPILHMPTMVLAWSTSGQENK
jgi:hypothetical protein